MDPRTNPRPLKPLTRPTLVDLAYDAVLRLLLSGEMSMGARLNESHLAEQLSISRGTLRVALHRLVSEGLAVERPRQGTYVSTFDADDVVDIYNVRAGIESVAARLATLRGADLTPLRAALAAMYEAAAADDLVGTMEQEYRFHEELCRASGNEQVIEVYRMLGAKVRLALSLDNRGNENLLDLPRRHEPVVEALASGDDRRAAIAVHRHIVGHVDQVVARMGGDPARLLPPLAEPPPGNDHQL
jgi:DNA-binding GntR family transcriptional regulator